MHNIVIIQPALYVHVYVSYVMNYDNKNYMDFQYLNNQIEIFFSNQTKKINDQTNYLFFLGVVMNWNQ